MKIRWAWAHVLPDQELQLFEPGNTQEITEKRGVYSNLLNPSIDTDVASMFQSATLHLPRCMHLPPRTIRDTSMLHFSTLVFQKSLGRDLARITVSPPQKKEWFEDIWGFKIRKGNFKMLRDRNVVSENGVCWCFLCVLKRLRFCRVKNTKCFLGLSPMKTLFICTLKAPRGSEKRITLARLYMSEWWYFSWISPEINRKQRWTSCSCSIFCLPWWWGLGRNHCNGMNGCSMIGWWKVWGKS